MSDDEKTPVPGERKARANRENGKKGGRPPFKLDGEEEIKKFDCMVAAGALEKDIAAAYGVDEDTINAMCKRQFGVGFSAYREQKMNLRKVRLAQIQWRMVEEDRNPAMAIFLGKNWLGQSDRQQHDHNVRSNNTVIYLPDNGR